MKRFLSCIFTNPVLDGVYISKCASGSLTNVRNSFVNRLAITPNQSEEELVEILTRNGNSFCELTIYSDISLETYLKLPTIGRSQFSILTSSISKVERVKGFKTSQQGLGLTIMSKLPPTLSTNFFIVRGRYVSKEILMKLCPNSKNYLGAEDYE